MRDLVGCGVSFNRFCRSAVIALVLILNAVVASAQSLSINSGPDFGTSPLGEIQIELDASGGNGSYSWSLTGSLPPGLALRTDLAPFFSSNASAGLIGVATSPGTYSFNLAVSSGGQTVSRACTLKITRFFVQDIYMQADAFVNVAYFHKFTPINNAGTVTFTVDNGLPPGLSLSGDGTLSGTPTKSGFYNIAMHMTDGVDTVYLTRAVPVFDVRITTDGTLPNTTQDAPYNTAIIATGGAPPYTFTSGGLPGNLVLSSSGVISGSLSYSPGHYGFNVTATDSQQRSYTRTMSVDVLGQPAALPSISPYGAIAAFDDCAIGQTDCVDGIGVHSGGKAPFTWIAVGLPAGLSIRYGSSASSYINPGDAEIVGHPTQTGDFNVTVTVTDADGATATNTFPLHISELFEDYNDRIPGGTFGVPYSQRLRVIGGTSPYTVADLDDRLPNGLFFDATNFRLSGTPSENGGFDAVLRFGDSVGHHVTTSNYFGIGFPANGSQTLTINIGKDLGTLIVGDFYSNQLTACCAPSYVWSVVGGSLPPGFTLSPGGVLSGLGNTPGIYNFTLQVADASNPGNFAVRYTKLTISPIRNTTQYFLPSGNVGTPYSFAFAATGGTGMLTWTLPPGQYLPPGLSLSVNGVVSGTPGASGQVQGNLLITDQAGHVTPAYFDLSIYPAGINPPLDLPLGPDLGIPALGRVYYQLQASGGTPPYHYSLTPGATVIPGMRVQDGQPLPQWFQPQATGGFLGVITTPGFYSTSIRVTDSAGSIFDRDIHFTVMGLEYSGQYILPNATVNSPYAFTLQATGGSGNYEFSEQANGNVPSGLTVSPAGLISGTPTTAGFYNLNLIITDLSTSQRYYFGVGVTVEPFAITTGGILPGAIVGAAYSEQFIAPGCGSGCTWSLFGGGLPGNVFMSASGLLSGTPNNSGNFTFTVQASGSAGTVQKRFSWSVTPSTPQPVLVSINGDLGSVTFADTPAFQLFAKGGTPPYSWSVLSGSLPAGMSLQGPGEILSSNFNPGYTILTGRALSLGISNFTLQVTDANNNSATQAFTLNVSSMGVEYYNLPIPGNPLVYNTAYTQPLLAVGGDGNYTWTDIDPLQGLSLTNAGFVNGTPANTGQYFDQIRATDGHGNYFQYYLGLNIASGTAATLTFNSGPNLGTRQLGNQQTIFLNPFGGTGPYTVSALTSLPPGFVLLTDGNQPAGGASANNFIISGTPMLPGTYSFTVEAQDSQGNLGVRTFSISIAPFVIFDSTTLADGSVGIPYSVPLIAFDNTGTPTWAVAPGAALPPGLTLSSGGLLSGMPMQAGQFSFQVTAMDGGATITYNVNVHISNLAIIDSEALPDGAVGVPYSYSFAAAGTAGVIWSATGLPSGLHISSSGVISGTPQASTRAGVFVTATMGTDHVREHFVLYVTQPNPAELTLPPLSFPDAVLGQNYQNALAPSGGTPPYAFAVVGGSTLPPGLSLYSGPQLQSIQSTRVPAVTVLAGVPSAAGNYSFSLVLTDAAGRQTSGTFTLNVAALNVLPSGIPSGTPGKAYSQQFSVAGGTAPYSFSVSPTDLFTLTLPPGITMSPTGLLSGITSDTGDFGFVLHVQDANGLSFSRSYFFSFINQKGLEVYVGPLYDTHAGSGSFTCFNTNGNSTYTWRVVSGALPPGMQIQEEDVDCGPNHLWGLTGAAITPGVYTFTLRATDQADAGNSADQTVSLRVVPFERVSPAFDEVATRPLPVGVVGQSYSFSFRFAGGKAPYSVTESPFYPLPAGLTLSSDGVLSGTPQSSGSFVLIPVVTDAQSYSANISPSRLVITPPGTVSPLVSTCCYDFGYYSLNGPFDDASVGVPYHFNLDDFLQGGTAPYSWSVTPGASLPTGMSLMLGANGVPNHLGGIPTTPGNYTIQLTASDASGQSLNFNLSGPVSLLALSPDYLPPSTVGASYSVSLVPSGGTPPYAFQLQPYSELPSGLSLSPNGVLSGTPNYPGYFKLYVALTDNTGNSLNKAYQITIDNASGDSPVLVLSPKPIQVLYTIGSATPVTIPLSVGTTSGAYSFALAESGLPAATLSANTGTTPASINLAIDTSGLVPGTYSGLIGAAAPQTANQFDTVPVLLTVVQPPPCTYTLNPSGSVIGSGGGPGGFTVSTGAACSWTATVSDSSWISIKTGCAIGHICASYSATGSHSLSFQIAANLGASQRTGTITVNGAKYTITQFASSACSFGINPANLLVSSGAQLVPVTISASQSTCSWTANGLNVTPASGTGSGTATLTIPSNATATTQILSATIAGQAFTATQSGANCTVALNASSASFPANGGPGAVLVAIPAGCSYSTVTGPSWITVNSGGSGNSSGNLLFTVDANSTTQSRTGGLSIGGQPFQITEQGVACSISVDTSKLGSPFGNGGGAGAIGINTNGNSCSWSAQAADPWIKLTPASGIGPGTIGVTIDSNSSSASPRSSSVAINGQSVTVSQSGQSCSYALQSPNGTVPAAGGIGLVGVIAPSACSWSAGSNDPSWLSISSSGTGGNADVQFVAQANPNASPRTGTLTIAGLAYTVTEAAAPCTYSLDQSTVNVASSGLSSGSFNFATAASGCSPSAMAYSNWLTVSTTFGGNAGSVSYSVAPNPSGSNRQGVIQIGEQAFTVTQNAAACAYSLNAYGAVFSKAGGSSDVLGSPNALGCSPVTGTDQPSFIALDPLLGPTLNIFTQGFEVTPFVSAVPNLRFGNITFGGQIFAIKQTSW